MHFRHKPCIHIATVACMILSLHLRYMILFTKFKGALRIFDNPVLVGLAVPFIPAQLGPLSQVGPGDVQDEVEV